MLRSMATVEAGPGSKPDARERILETAYELFSRRAIRDGAMIGIEKPFLGDLVPEVALGMGNAYPELREGASGISGVIAAGVIFAAISAVAGSRSSSTNATTIDD